MDSKNHYEEPRECEGNKAKIAGGTNGYTKNQFPERLRGVDQTLA